MADNTNPNIPIADAQPIPPPDIPVVPPPPPPPPPSPQPAPSAPQEPNAVPQPPTSPTVPEPIAPPLPPLPPLPSTPEPIQTPMAPLPSSNKHGASFHKKKFPVMPILMVLLLIGGLLGALLLTQQKQETRSKASSSDVTLRLSGRREATAGAELQVNATISTNDLEVTAADLILTFDPNYLKFLESKPGKALPTVIAQKHASNSAELVVALVCEQKCTPYKGAGQEIGSFRFKMLKATESDSPVKLMFGPKTAITAIGTKANVKGDLTNVIHSLVIRTSGTAPSPTLTLTPTQTPMASPTATLTPTLTPTITPTPTPTLAPTLTPTQTP